jgi:UDP-N-acetylmuramoyl-tripeptide--D-alanyl-D-alanine ligase
LQQLAKYHRQQFNSLPQHFGIPFLAITGSNGKTTTKELIHAVLSTTYKTYTTEGNLNNHIGIPLTILKIKNDAEIVVIEMGANHQKEIESYCKYTLPTHGLITNCGKAHLEGFINEAGVRKGKGELFDYLRANNGTAFIMNDYEYLQEMSQGISQIIKYGSFNADVEGIAIDNETQLTVEIKKGNFTGKIKTQLVGDFNLPNVLAAVTVGIYFKVPAEKIKSAIENYVPSNSRSQLIEKGTNKIILDAYNANPSSMKLAIENFAKVKDGKKILILGAMAELGKESVHEHQQIISLINKFKWDEVILVGENFNNLSHPYKKFSSSNEAKEWFKNQHFQNTFFLVKGSRSTQMENIID